MAGLSVPFKSAIRQKGRVEKCEHLRSRRSNLACRYRTPRGGSNEAVRRGPKFFDYLLMNPPFGGKEDCFVSLPGGVSSSAGAGVKTNLVFDRRTPGSNNGRDRSARSGGGCCVAAAPLTRSGVRMCESIICLPAAREEGSRLRLHGCIVARAAVIIEPWHRSRAHSRSGRLAKQCVGTSGGRSRCWFFSG